MLLSVLYPLRSVGFTAVLGAGGIKRVEAHAWVGVRHLAKAGFPERRLKMTDKDHWCSRDHDECSDPFPGRGWRWAYHVHSVCVVVNPIFDHQGCTGSTTVFSVSKQLWIKSLSRTTYSHKVSEDLAVALGSSRAVLRPWSHILTVPERGCLRNGMLRRCVW